MAEQCEGTLRIAYNKENPDDPPSLSFRCLKRKNHSGKHLCTCQLTALYFECLMEKYPGIEDWDLELRQDKIVEMLLRKNNES